MKKITKKLLISLLLLSPTVSFVMEREIEREDVNKLASKLFKAIERGDVAQVDQALNLGADIDRPDEDGDEPLMVAAWYGHSGVAELLLDNGAKIDKRNKSGRTPLMVAAWRGHSDVVRLLLDNGADLNKKGRQGETVRKLARGNQEIEKIIEDFIA